MMSHGLPYDSDAARRCAAAITAVMTGEAYAQSARIARDCGGPFSGYGKNAEPFLRVMRKHRDALDDAHLPAEQRDQIRGTWDEAISLGEAHGFRNAQATVLAPTGTIAFMMDCDTTGVEPDIALVKYKHLVDGGTIRIVNRTVRAALERLGYNTGEVEAILAHIDETGTIEGAKELDPKDLPVFDCADRPPGGTRSIHHTGHLKMIAAVQPFISGAISKTVNLPNEATVDDIEETCIEAWRLGAKSVSVYRNGSKRTQPLNTGLARNGGAETPRPVRRKLPDERRAVIHKFDIAGYKGYITVGMFEDGSPGEMFLVMSKEGSTISGFADSFAQAVSYALQYGVPLQVLVDKFSHARFEPAGLTKNPDVRIAKSIVDYVFRWMATRFLSPEAQFHAGVNTPREPAGAGAAADGGRRPGPAADASDAGPAAPPPAPDTQDAPPCVVCGAIMIRNGACYSCTNCGATSGCG
jgi:ribonucleoside-diphosphate reductase alpha chain